MVTDNSEIPVGNPLADAEVKKLRRTVEKPRKIPKLLPLRGKSYRLNLGVDRDGKAVEPRVGSDKKYAEAVRKAWNVDMERKDGTARLTELGEITRLDVRKAHLLLEPYPSIELAESTVAQNEPTFAPWVMPSATPWANPWMMPSPTPSGAHIRTSDSLVHWTVCIDSATSGGNIDPPRTVMKSVLGARNA